MPPTNDKNNNDLTQGPFGKDVASKLNVPAPSSPPKSNVFGQSDSPAPASPAQQKPAPTPSAPASPAQPQPPAQPAKTNIAGVDVIKNPPTPKTGGTPISRRCKCSKCGTTIESFHDIDKCTKCGAGSEYLVDAD